MLAGIAAHPVARIAWGSAIRSANSVPTTTSPALTVICSSTSSRRRSEESVVRERSWTSASRFCSRTWASSDSIRWRMKLIVRTPETAAAAAPSPPPMRARRGSTAAPAPTSDSVSAPASAPSCLVRSSPGDQRTSNSHQPSPRAPQRGCSTRAAGSPNSSGTVPSSPVVYSQS